MNLAAALILLASASDSFDALNGWQLGIRSDIQTEIVQVDDDSCLRISSNSVGDLVRLFPRPVLASERPFAQACVWIPPFDEWPTQPNQNGTYNYCGFRLTITRSYGDHVWPGIFLSRPNGQSPTFTCRILTDYPARTIETSGWWTIGIGRSEVSGSLAFYAVGGKQDLTEADCFFTDPSPFPVIVTSFDGWFLQAATPQPWYFGAVQLYADIQPRLTIERAVGAVALTTGYPGMTIERSTDLVSWLPVTSPDPITQPQQFYRLR